jgi:hypothetical protein
VSHQLRAHSDPSKASDCTDVQQGQSDFGLLVDTNYDRFRFFAQVGALCENIQSIEMVFHCELFPSVPRRSAVVIIPSLS